MMIFVILTQFFSYDPSGLEEGRPLPIKYCTHCRCPSAYCANIVLGPQVYDEMTFLLFRNTFAAVKDDSPRGIKILFKYYYKRAVQSKMRINDIEFPMGYDISQGYVLPNCIRQGCLNEILQEVEKNNKKNMENPEDLSIIELERFQERYKTHNDGEVKVYYDKPLN